MKRSNVHDSGCRCATQGWWLAAVAIAAALGCSAGEASVITNQANASFVDGSGRPYRILSNIDSATTLSVLPPTLDASISVSAASVMPSEALTYQVSVRNPGPAEATGTAITVDGTAKSAIVLRDTLPTATTFAGSGATVPAGVQLLYHVVGAAQQTYVSAAPPAWTSIDAIAFTVPSLAAAAQFGGSFTVTVNGNASVGGSVRLSNSVEVLYGGTHAPASTTSNQATTTVGSVSNVLGLYTAADDKTQATSYALGASIYVRASASACNANPLVRETRTLAVSDSAGDRESYVATETGPNTGVFEVAGIATALPPVVAGDGVVEGANGDTLKLQLLGCGTPIEATVTLLDPSGVVFDSRSNLPVADASITLVTAAARGCSQTPAAVEASIDGVVQPVSATSVTDSSGAYHFPLVAPGDYCLVVVPPTGYAFPSRVPADKQPAGRRILATGPLSGGSYGGVFSVSQTTGPVSADVPLDPHALSGLFVQKVASKSSAELGDFVDYSVSIANNTGVTLAAGGSLLDALPAGFAYAPGTTRLNGVAAADPLGGQGPSLAVRLPALAAGSTTLLSYRVKIGPGATRGDGVNRAQAEVGSTLSNVATAAVHIDGGVFGDAAFVLGKVYLDCNQNRQQDAGEQGVPGIRLYLEDGTNVITDGEGKYSIYGISAKTHVLKLDRSSLPPGALLEVLTNRNARDPGSVFVDAQNGELHKTDFALGACDAGTLAAVTARREKLSGAGSTQERLLRPLDPDGSIKPLADVRGLPASGVLSVQPVGPQTPGQQLAAPQPRDGAGFNSLSNDASKLASTVSGIAPPRAVAAPVDLEMLLPQLDNDLGFIGLRDHDTLPMAQANIRVKGASGVNFVLTVNGSAVSAAHVGKKSVLADKSLQAWEYFGVDLAPGSNHLELTQTDQFGNARGHVALDVMAPDRLAQVDAVVEEEVVADAHSAARILVTLHDVHGTPVTARTPVTLEASIGRWEVEDLDPREPGVQVFIEGGAREFRLSAPQDPGDSSIRVTVAGIMVTAHATFLPDLRPLIASGVVEGVLNLRRLDVNALTPAQRQDGFEAQLANLSRTWSGGTEEAEARAAVFLKGKVRGDYLLTLGYDSDKDTQTRLFRDIQPDQFYPVYGDSAVRGFDAQSTSRLYVRIDKGRSWLLYGDLTTQSTSDARQLSNYNRSLTGIKEHYETSKVVANAFASSDSTTQVIDEIKADGTSGPFPLSTPNLVENSERVDLLVRDRNQPALILSVTTLQRFVDYEMEPLTGQLLLKAPVASLDPSFNPQSIRVTYEVDQGGAKFWVAGVDAQYKVSNRIEAGGVFVDDRNPANPAKLEGINSTVKFGDKTFLVGEVAQTDSETYGAGTGERVELKHDDGALQARIYADKTDLTFNNAGSSVTPGHTEAGARWVYHWSDTVSLHGEAVRSEDATTSGQLNGAMVSAEKRLKHGLRVEVGARRAEQNTQQTTAAAAAAAPAGTGVPGVPPVDLNSLRLKVSAPVPNFARASVYGEYEQDVRDSDKKLAALGGEYQVAAHSRLYFRDEVISSLSGPDSLNSVQKQNATVFGVDSDYMKDGRVFSEYRIRDAYSGGDAEAAIGLRNRWPVAPGLTLTTTEERVHTLSGIATEEATAGSLGVDYTANPSWKSSGRVELRDATNNDSLLLTLGTAVKLSDDWIALAREALADSRNTTSATGARKQERMQAGIAYRDTATSIWNALGMVEHRYETDTTAPATPLKETTEIVSLSGNVQLHAPTVLTLRAAAKWVLDDSNGLSSYAATQLLSARITQDIARDWDMGLSVSTLWSGADAHQFGLGMEAGYNLTANLWLSAGYNFFGYREAVLTGTDYANSGVYLRIRFKFDENLLAGATGGFDKPITKPVTGAPP